MKGKIAIVHDSFFVKGWAERMNIQIAKILDADIVAAVFSDASFDLESMGFKGKKFSVYPGFRRWMFGFLMMKLSFLFRTYFLREYDTIIFSNEGISAQRFSGSAFKVYYAHSISRHLFDQKEQYMQKAHPLIRPFFSLALTIFRCWYIRDLRSMDLIFANSQKNAEFLKSLAPSVQVKILYPPVDTLEFFPGWEKGKYYLSYARLAHAKRVDVIIEAFKLMPEKNLLVIYGKNDPQKDEFMKLAEGVPNITFRTLDNNAELPDIVRRAIAVIYVAKNEDFGMNTIESLASAVPVIAVAEGGFIETMIDGETGMLLPAYFTPYDLADAVRTMTPDLAESYAANSVIQAQKFSLENFEKKLKGFLEMD